MICHKCGATIPDDSVFCENCGEPLETTEYVEESVNAEEEPVYSQDAEEENEVLFTVEDEEDQPVIAGETDFEERAELEEVEVIEESDEPEDQVEDFEEIEDTEDTEEIEDIEEVEDSEEADELDETEIIEDEDEESFESVDQFEETEQIEETEELEETDQIEDFDETDQTEDSEELEEEEELEEFESEEQTDTPYEAEKEIPADIPTSIEDLKVGETGLPTESKRDWFKSFEELAPNPEDWSAMDEGTAENVEVAADEESEDASYSEDAQAESDHKPTVEDMIAEELPDYEESRYGIDHKPTVEDIIESELPDASDVPDEKYVDQAPEVSDDEYGGQQGEEESISDKISEGISKVNSWLANLGKSVHTGTGWALDAAKEKIAELKSESEKESAGPETSAFAEDEEPQEYAAEETKEWDIAEPDEPAGESEISEFEEPIDGEEYDEVEESAEEADESVDDQDVTEQEEPVEEQVADEPEEEGASEADESEEATEADEVEEPAEEQEADESEEEDASEADETEEAPEADESEEPVEEEEAAETEEPAIEEAEPEDEETAETEEPAIEAAEPEDEEPADAPEPEETSEPGDEEEAGDADEPAEPEDEEAGDADEPAEPDETEAIESEEPVDADETPEPEDDVAPEDDETAESEEIEPDEPEETEVPDDAAEPEPDKDAEPQTARQKAKLERKAAKAIERDSWSDAEIGELNLSSDFWYSSNKKDSGDGSRGSGYDRSRKPRGVFLTAKRLKLIVILGAIAVLIIGAGGVIGSNIHKEKEAEAKYNATLAQGAKYVEAKDYEKAETVYSNLIAQYPDRAELYENLARTYIAAEKFDEAKKTIETGIAKTGKSESYNALSEEVKALTSTEWREPFRRVLAGNEWAVRRYEDVNDVSVALCDVTGDRKPEMFFFTQEYYGYGKLHIYTYAGNRAQEITYNNKNRSTENDDAFYDVERDESSYIVYKGKKAGEFGIYESFLHGGIDSWQTINEFTLTGTDCKKRSVIEACIRTDYRLSEEDEDDNTEYYKNENEVGYKTYIKEFKRVLADMDQVVISSKESSGEREIWSNIVDMKDNSMTYDGAMKILDEDAN